MSRSCASLLASLAILSAPATAFADCPSSMAPPTRLNCLNTALTVAVAAIAALETANDALEASNATLVASNAALVTQVAALDDEVANISADYLVSGDLDDYTTFDYVDSLVGAFTDGIPNLSDYLSVDTGTDSIVFTGANVYVQNGVGATEWVNGLGNLVVGYNEDESAFLGGVASDRTGSHNLVVGVAHSYSSAGSLVAGFMNSTTAPFSSVSGGEHNIASGWASSVSGGHDNEASGIWATASGGALNEVSGDGASVSGGVRNIGAGIYSSILGGTDITLSSDWAHSP